MALPNLPVQSTINQYVASGSEATFNFNYYITQDADLVVYLLLTDGTPVLQVLNSDYTVTQAGDPTTGGTITFALDPESGDIVTIYRNVQADYNFNFSIPQTINGANMDSAYQQSILVSQQNQSSIALRCLKYGVYDEVIVNSFSGIDQTTLPILGDNQVWVGTEDGNVAAYTFTQNDSILRSQLASQAEGSDGASLVGYFNETTSAGETVSEALNNIRQGNSVNPLINSNFSVWQRGYGPFTFTTETNNGNYSADRWISSTDGTMVVEGVPIFNPAEPQLFQSNRGATIIYTPGGGTDFTFGNSYPGVKLYNGQTVTGVMALYNNTASALSGELQIYQEMGTGGSPSPHNSFLLGTFNIPASSGAIVVGTTTIASLNGITLGTNQDDSLILYAVMNPAVARSVTFCWAALYAGTSAPPYASKPYATELTACQGFFQTTYPDGVAPGTPITPEGCLIYAPVYFGASQDLSDPADNNGIAQWALPFRTKMVKTPTVTWYNPSSGAANNIDMNSGSKPVIGTDPIYATSAAGTGLPLLEATGTLLIAYAHYVADTGL